MSQSAAYGSWGSPISATLVAAGAVGFVEPTLDGDDVYWIETRPVENGRAVIVRRTAAGVVSEVTPPPFSARTRVHEYGGGAFTVAGGTVYFSNFNDHRLYRHDAGRALQPLTPEGPFRYADLVADRRHHRLLGVREDHRMAGSQPVNTLISIDLAHGGAPAVLAGGADFYASPRLSPDGTQLAWLSWNHPNMPWDGTELWLAAVQADGLVSGARRVAGGTTESIFQPEWSPAGVLHFVSDRTGWWNLYRWRDQGAESLWAIEAELGLPQWVFGMRTYACTSATSVVCAYSRHGTWQLELLNTASATHTPIATPYSDIMSVRAAADRLVFVGAAPTEAPAIVQLDLGGNRLDVVRRANAPCIDDGYLSRPVPIAFPSSQGRTAHAFFYAPCNRDYIASADTLPPLLVTIHGGPTAAASTALSLKTQYWTSRGFAVLDVNYGGSTGYGRAYRQQLDGQWGIVDVDDCVAGARFVAEHGWVDGERLAIRGSSAGGYTALCALTFRNVFKAGAIYYGIGDLEALARDTHKFESHYEERLVGPYPQRRDLYHDRSPLHFTDRLSCPVIFFQGLDDRVVLPSQAEAMVAALRAKRIPVAYVPFAGEQHGFRRAETIVRALEAELYFYVRVFGLTLAERIEPVPIENL